MLHKRKMLASFYTKPGRNGHATNVARGLKVDGELLPPDFVVLNASQVRECASLPLHVKHVECHIPENAKAHRTGLYAQTTERCLDSPQLVLRRGQRFSLSLTFDRPYNKAVDEITFIFKFGEDVAGISSGSLIKCRASDGVKPRNWSAGVIDAQGNNVIIHLMSPPNGIVGKATLMIDTEVVKSTSDESCTTSRIMLSAISSKLSQKDSIGEGEEEEEKEGEKNLEEEEEEEEEKQVKQQSSKASTVGKTDENDDEESTASRDHKRKILRYTHQQPVYLLFNPWNQDDQVFMANEIESMEYVLKDFGHIYYGNQYQVSAYPWHYSQFELGVLDTAVYLLDMAALRPSARGCAVSVVRTIAKLVNAADDNGVMVGNWSGNYAGGTPPTQWIGSFPILTEFMERKESVKYGQCWVFAAVATTLCRALGIPTRCVTNFGSAHDCDGGNTIDMHWNCVGEPVDDQNKDGLWSFHVWNESYMTRPDIDAGLPGSWQAFDVTPQVTTDGMYCAGPCAVETIKRGNIFQRYDCSLMFFDIYADIVHWNLLNTGSWRTIIEKNRTGRKIITEALTLDYPGSSSGSSGSSSSSSTTSVTSAEQHQPVFPIVDVQSECQDITRFYKHPQGSEEERASLQRAYTFFKMQPIYDKGCGDVKYEFIQQEPIKVGNEFNVVVRAQNKCRFERFVSMTLTLASIHYTGLTKTRLRSETFDFNLCPLRGRDVVMRFSVEDYSYYLSEFAMFRIYLHATVTETEQMTTTFSDFRLILPELQIVAPRKAQVGEPFECIVLLSSPMLISLQKCQWMVEAPGLLTAVKVPHDDLDPYEKAQIKVMMNPTHSGKTFITASFHSSQLTGLTGCVEVDVRDERNSPQHAGAMLFSLG